MAAEPMLSLPSRSACSSCWPPGCCAAGASLRARYSTGVLCLFEVVSFSGWARHSALDWIYQTTFAVVSLAGLIGADRGARQPPAAQGRGLTRRYIAQVSDSRRGRARGAP